MENENNFEVTIELTHKCPFKCPHCSSNNLKFIHLKEEYILNRITQLIKLHDKLSIRISGGEILCWKFNLFHLLTKIRDFNIPITILTTGSDFKLNPMPSNFFSIINKIGTTIYGDAIHHAQFFSPNNFEKGLRAYRNVKELLINARACKIPVEIHVIPFDSNITTINDFAKTVGEIPANDIIDKLPPDFAHELIPINDLFDETFSTQKMELGELFKFYCHLRSLAFNYPNVTLRGLKILPQGRGKNIIIPPEIQLKFLKSIPNVKISHSFKGHCDIYNKLVILPNGNEVNCSANKCINLGCITRRCDLFFTNPEFQAKQIQFQE
jgi:hypothetical protein